jgi:hypothetical protein
MSHFARLCVIAIAFLVAASGLIAQDRVPTKLTDQEFWTLVDSLSEATSPTYTDDNLISNELSFRQDISTLVPRAPIGRAYIGVGPEQNFTYVAHLKPAIAFIVDVRRSNLLLHLIYKALFELSSDRTEFLSLLFSKFRSARATGEPADVETLIDQIGAQPTLDERASQETLGAVLRVLLDVHHLPLSDDDRDCISRIYRAFYWYGPMLDSGSNTLLSTGGIRGGPTFRDLANQSDANGRGVTFLSSEDRFLYVKGLEVRNLIVPVVGDFAGTHALRSIGDYLRRHALNVGVFYLSNVENYLRRERRWGAFCRNAAALPTDEGSLFIRITTTSMTLFPHGIPVRMPQADSTIASIREAFAKCE